MDRIGGRIEKVYICVRCIYTCVCFEHIEVDYNIREAIINSKIVRTDGYTHPLTHQNSNTNG